MTSGAKLRLRRARGETRCKLTKVYDEVIEFIATSSPLNVIAFRPSEEAKARVANLILREKTEGLPDDEKSELDHYLHIEHLMRLAKALASLSGKWLDGLVRNFVNQFKQASQESSEAPP